MDQSGCRGDCWELKKRVLYMQRTNLESLSTQRKSQGFTLVEAMVAIAIMGILLTIGIPSMSNLINDMRASSSTNEFLGAVALARSEAIKRGRLVTICRSVNAESGTTGCNTATSGDHDGADWGVGWLVYVENSSSANVGTYQAGEEVLLRHGALPGKTYAANSTSRRITFNGTGEPIGSLAGFSVNFNFDGKYERQICMARSGRIRVIRDATVCP